MMLINRNLILVDITQVNIRPKIRQVNGWIWQQSVNTADFKFRPIKLHSIICQKET